MRGLVCIIFVSLAGCAPSGPRAPALVTESVFADPEIGLRFPVPDGWVIGSRTVPPPGPVTHPTRIVSYLRQDGGGRAEFEVYLADLDSVEALREYLIAQPIGSEKWQWPTAPTPTTVGGISGGQYTLTARTLKRDITIIPRGGSRHILFLATAAASDDKAFNHVQQAVAAAAWD